MERRQHRDECIFNEHLYFIRINSANTHRLSRMTRSYSEGRDANYSRSSLMDKLDCHTLTRWKLFNNKNHCTLCPSSVKSFLIHCRFCGGDHPSRKYCSRAKYTSRRWSPPPTVVDTVKLLKSFVRNTFYSKLNFSLHTEMISNKATRNLGSINTHL